MPRTKPSTNNATISTTSTAALLNDFSHPYPTPSTSPLLVPTLPPPPSPLSALTASLTIKTPNQQYVHDSTLSLPVGTTLSIPRKNGSSRIGQSILGQLLAAHKPGRDHHKLSSDATLSLETIRPKEQQRRSILPMSWTLGFQKSTSMQGLSMAPSPSALQHPAGKLVSGSTLASAGRSVMENEPNEQQHPVLPSVWLESVLSRLSRSDLNTPPHYATLPRVNLQEQGQPPLRQVFANMDPRPKDRKDDSWKGASKVKPGSSSTVKSKGSAALKTKSSAPTMTRRGSACELALGEDARELFQQNRPKTLSSAVITSSIVPAKESLRNVRQRSLDSSSAAKPSSTLPAKLPRSSTSSYPPAPVNATTKTTRGRFTIESASPHPFRTRTLSCTATSPPVSLSHQQQLPATEKPTLSVSPSPCLSFSLPSGLSVSTNPPSSIPPSPCLSPAPPTVHTLSLCSYDPSSDEANNSTSTPIPIPLVNKTSHQRTHSSSSIQSSASTSSRHSQVIIPPPAYAASTLQFASFSSITSSKGGTNGNVSPHLQNQQLPSRRPSSKNGNSNGSNGSNNFRNLSIQIVGGEGQSDTSQDSQDFHLDAPTVHPLDEDSTSASLQATLPGLQISHQTMNRVHPHQDSIDSPGDSNAPFTAYSTGRSSVSSMNSSLDISGGASGSGAGIRVSSGQSAPESGYNAGYLRQRSLSATNLDSGMVQHMSNGQSNYRMRQQRNSAQLTAPEGSSWSDRTTRRTHGSVSSSDQHHHHYPRSSTPVIMAPSSYSGAGSLSSSSHSHGEISDIVMVKKSATGRMFTVERTIPASPTKCSRFIVVSSTDDLCVPTPSPPRPSSPLQKCE